MYYTRKVWSHIFCMEEYASWILWGGSDKADSRDRSSKCLSKAESCAEQKCQAGYVWRKNEVSVPEAFLQPISSQKGSHCPYISPPRAARATESSLCGFLPVLRPVSACLHNSSFSRSSQILGVATCSHAHAPEMFGASCGFRETRWKDTVVLSLCLKAMKTLWAGIHSGSSELTLWRVQADGEGRGKSEE